MCSPGWPVMEDESQRLTILTKVTYKDLEMLRHLSGLVPNVVFNLE